MHKVMAGLRIDAQDRRASGEETDLRRQTLVDVPLPPEAITFNVIHNDGLIRVRIENGFATFTVDLIQDVGVVVQGLSRAVAAGATRGTMFTGEVVNDQIAAMHTMRAASGTTWLGGKVTRLADGPEGPQFRIDWSVLPTFTE
jgi:hypothetical protein